MKIKNTKGILILEQIKFDNTLKRTVIKNNDAGMNLHMILTTYINRSTNTVYLVLYEAPENEWKNDRNTVNVFIKNMKFNDKY